MALTLPKLTLPKLAVPKMTLDKKKLVPIVGAVVVLAAAAWFGWGYFMEEPAPPPPPPKLQAVKAAKKPTPAQQAEATAKAHAKMIEDVISVTGLKPQLDELPQRFVAGVQESGKQMKKAPPAVVKAIEEEMARAFTAQGFQDRVSADLKKNFDQKRMQALLKEFSTPTAKAMVGMERAAHSAEEFSKFAGSKEAKQPAPERAALIQRIDAATKASGLAVDVAFASMKALALGMGAADERRAGAIDKAMEKQRAASTKKIRDATLLNLAFSYKDASNADLEKFAAIYESENSKWFSGLVHDAVLEEVKSASAKAGEQIANLKVAPAPKRAHAKLRGDARACLKLATNAEIIKCAEDYR